MSIQLSLDTNLSSYQITSITSNSVHINKKEYTSSFIVTAKQLLENQELLLEQINLKKLQEKLQVDIIIIGTKEKKTPSSLLTQKVPFEMMSINAACRTYTVLSAENRKCALAVIF